MSKLEPADDIEIGLPQQGPPSLVAVDNSKDGNQVPAGEKKKKKKRKSSKPTWIAATDAKGQTYYYHSKTLKAQWEKPHEFEPEAASQKENQQEQKQQALATITSRGKRKNGKEKKDSNEDGGTKKVPVAQEKQSPDQESTSKKKKEEVLHRADNVNREQERIIVDIVTAAGSVLVTARKQPELRLGMVLVQKPNKGILITEIKSPSMFAGTGLRTGMTVLGVNGSNVSDATVKEVAAMIRSTSTSVLTIEAREIVEEEEIAVPPIGIVEEEEEITVPPTVNTSTIVNTSTTSEAPSRAPPALLNLLSDDVQETPVPLVTATPVQVTDHPSPPMPNNNGAVVTTDFASEGGSVTVTVQRRQPTGGPTGLVIADRSAGGVVITGIPNHCIFHGTSLKVGMRLLRINESDVYRAQSGEVAALILSSTEETLTIKAMDNTSRVIAMDNISGVITNQQQSLNTLRATTRGGETTRTPVVYSRKERECMATASVLCGVLGLFIFGIVLGPIAICMAFSALSQIREHPDRYDDKSKCHANTGICLGIVDIVGWMIVMMLYF